MKKHETGIRQPVKCLLKKNTRASQRIVDLRAADDQSAERMREQINYVIDRIMAPFGPPMAGQPQIIPIRPGKRPVEP